MLDGFKVPLSQVFCKPRSKIDFQHYPKKQLKTDTIHNLNTCNLTLNVNKQHEIRH